MHSLSPDDLLEALSMVPALFCHAGTDGRFTWLGGNWEEALGYTHAEILSSPTMSLVHPDDIESTEAAMSVLKAGDFLRDFENRLRHKLGHYEWVRWNSHASETHLASVLTIITQEHAQRQALLEKTELLLLSERLAKLGHWRLNLATEELLWSDEVYRIHGMDPSDPQPDLATAMSFYHPDDAGIVRQHGTATIESGTPYDFELRLIRVDGVERFVHSRGQVEYNSDGSPGVMIGILQDITQARMIQQRLQNGERLASVSLLASGIAHEINNPLQYVFANIGLAQEQLEELGQNGKNPWASGLNELLEDAMHGSKQVARIVGDLRTFMSQRTTGDAIVDLNEVIKTTINMTRSEIRHRAKMFEDIGQMPNVKADYAELIQVFINLLTNAADAVEPLGVDSARIRLSSQTDAQGWAVIEVEDNGPGIALEDQVRIFEAFYTTKPAGLGSGLGLHISRSIIERRGGTITLQSKPGLTVFQVRLPPGIKDEKPAENPITSMRIMVVDDDPRVAQTVGRMLSGHYHCKVETDPRVALERLVTEHFDAVISDVMMPNLMGWEMILMAQAQNPDLIGRALLMSGAALESQLPSEAFDLPLLKKPFGPDDLRTALSALL